MLQPGQISISHVADNGTQEQHEFRLEFGKPGGLPLGLGKYYVINGLKIHDYHGNLINNDHSSNLEAEITSIGDKVGDYIDISFNGTYIDEIGGEHTIVGLVHAYRDN